MDISALIKRVDDYFMLRYNKSLIELDITDTPGYWRDKEASIHPGHPLHGCLLCEGPFKATYTYYDKGRGKNGRFESITKTWREIKNHEAAERLRKAREE